MKKKDLVDKWLNDELTPEEFEVLRTLPEFSSYQKIDAFVHQLDNPEPLTEEGLIELKSKLSASSSSQSRFFSAGKLLRIAAAVALVLASYYFLSSNGSVMERTDLAQTKEIQLPDESTVRLNEDSELVYKSDDWSANREIKLEGEAYFEVAKGQTFSVVTNSGTVKVLGTKFNVNNRNNALIVRCFEGRVQVDSGDNSLVIDAGEGVSIALNNLTKFEVLTSTPAWLRNESTFDNMLIEKVVNVIAETYNVEIGTENIDVTLRYTGSFPNDNLEAALKAITLPLNLEYSIDSSGTVQIFSTLE